MKSIKKVIRYARKMLALTVVNIFGFMIVLCLYIIKPIKFIKLCIILHDRIGHLAGNTDLFLRRLQLKEREDGILYIGVSGKPANRQLLKMFKRKFFIIQIPSIKIIDILFHGISAEKSVLGKSVFYQPLPFNPNEYYEFNNTIPNLCFTVSEEEEGKKLLRKMDIDDNSWFVCFHSRDSIYLSNQWSKFYNSSKDWSYHDYRDCEVKNYLEAAKYIASCDGYAVRMGYGVAERLPNLNNPSIIDYASYHRTDFGDIYLLAKCKFFLGNSAGLWVVATIFHVPVACANYLPLELTPLREGNLFIPKKIWCIEKKRFLTFREILESGVGKYLYWQNGKYAESGLMAIENTAEEILDLAKEMNERWDGTFETTEEDEELQDKFHSLFQPHHNCYGSPARIGSKFLRQNRELLE